MLATAALRRRSFAISTSLNLMHVLYIRLINVFHGTDRCCSERWVTERNKVQRLYATRRNNVTAKAP